MLLLLSVGEQQNEWSVEQAGRRLCFDQHMIRQEEEEKRSVVTTASTNSRTCRRDCLCEYWNFGYCHCFYIYIRYLFRC
jgi:hypothetical protein